LVSHDATHSTGGPPVEIEYRQPLPSSVSIT
jgi:hypothetical protein